eukprot:CAMPEP_0185725970 /NCGR_PEP_ID=MMETSP1171-20130828/2092_1 /TAXON_ID=374046 /ORGANISM="Helicotheca tamensis, Strain CCMP826" /LENGTH=502 /DNA_ID=CAMNT_0028394225 /DNA_START=102 /DNA_END=1610 /DNA_ORIENTATION=+
MGFDEDHRLSFDDRSDYNNNSGVDDTEDVTLDDPDQLRQDLTYTTFDYNNDGNDDAEDKEKTIDEHGKETHENDEQNGHHSLPEYPFADAYHNRAVSCRNQLFSPWRSLCSKCNSLAVIFALAMVGCIIALISQQREIAKGMMDGVVGGPTEWAALPPARKPLQSLAFGSCSDQTLPMSYWDTLSSLRPDVTILMGDNVYGKCDESSCQILQDAYDALASHPSFIGARSMLPMVATLDNHDYGRNDANENNSMKDVAKEMFLDFFAVPSDDERRSRPNDGVYTSYEWGPKGQRIQVILLDVRYHHSEFILTDEYNAPEKERYIPDNNPEKRLMSEAQWGWLGGLIARPANVRLIVSSIQVMSDTQGFECWRMIPHERERFYKLLKPSLESTRTVLLSGDRHVGGFYKHEVEELYEVTASSWTHTIPFGAFDDCSNAQECDEDDPRRMDDFVRVNHFGMVELDWETREVTLSLRRVSSTLKDHYEVDGAVPGDQLQYHTFSIP